MTEKQKYLFKYRGPVTSFGKIKENYWEAGTQAVSIDRARCNIMCQYKRAHKMAMDTQIELPGELVQDIAIKRAL